MKIEEIHAQLKGRFGEAIGPLMPPNKDPFFTVAGDRLLEVCRLLKSDPAYRFDFLEDVTATDHLAENQIRVVYHLFSYQLRHELVIKVICDRATPHVPSVDPVWKTANWLEREVYDLFGVTFDGHPDLRRIMMPDDWIGFPLRKDYKEAGGYEEISNVREDPLAEYKRMDDAVREAATKSAAAGKPPPPEQVH
jgi:NADH-quinone oxidoreductase subunit C